MQRLARLVAFNLIVLAGVLAALETMLRLADWRPPGHFTNLRYENDPLAGPSLLPSQEGFFQTPCSRTARIHVNGFGMRDRERTLTATGPRVALIGDSFTEGLHVADEETTSRRLEMLLGGKAEVLNFGVGSTGTAVQLLSYRARVRAFRPDIVLVMFYVGNDVSDNMPALKSRADPVLASVSPYLLLDSSGTLAATPQPGQLRRSSRLAAWVSSSALGQWMYRSYYEVRIRLSSGGGAAGPDEASMDALLDEAWLTTERIVERFFEEVRADGARFAVVLVPGAEAEANRFALARLSAIANRSPFPVLDLSTRFRPSTHPDQGDPFSFVCDDHWNARGHAAAAEALLRFLSQQQWITPS